MCNAHSGKSETIVWARSYMIYETCLTLNKNPTFKMEGEFLQVDSSALLRTEDSQPGTL